MAFIGTSKTNGSCLMTSDTGVNDFSHNGSNCDIVYFEDDFIYYSTTGTIYWPWFMSANGTGSKAQISAGLATHPGIMTLETGTTTTGAGSVGKSTTINNIILGGGYVELNFIFNLNALSDATDEYSFYMGMGTGFSVFAANPGNDAVAFSYVRTTSVNWQGITKLGGVTTTATGGSNIAVATGWNHFKITINAGATSASFYINGTLIGTSASNIPTATAISPGVIGKKSAGTNNRTFDLDYISFYNKLTTSRFT